MRGQPVPPLLIALLLATPAALGIGLAGCSSDLLQPDPGEQPTPDEPAPDGGDAAETSGASLRLGDWTSYPAVEEGVEWSTEPLDEGRWAVVSAELGCVGRRSHGDPQAHRSRVRRIVRHYRTSAEAVMEYGIDLNRDRPEDALRLGQRVSEALRACR